MKRSATEVVEERAVIVDGRIDLAATLRALERASDFYRRELSAMESFAQTWKAPMDDVSDRHDEYRERADELATAIDHVRSVIARQ